MPYRLSPLAERDLDEIWSYVAEDATPMTADRLVDDIATDSIYWPNNRGWAVHVRSSALTCDRSQSRTTSSTIVEEGKDVLIARVLHGRRDQMAAWSASS
jgi:plasmid stabilization system protein ParE